MPQKELKKSKLRAEVSGDVVRAYLANEVVDDCCLAYMMQMWYLFSLRGWLKMQQTKNTLVNGWHQERS